MYSFKQPASNTSDFTFPKYVVRKRGESFGYLWVITSDFFFLMSEFFVLDFNTLFMPLSLCHFYSTDVFFFPNSCLPYNCMLSCTKIFWNPDFFFLILFSLFPV